MSRGDSESHPAGQLGETLPTVQLKLRNNLSVKRIHSSDLSTYTPLSSNIREYFLSTSRYSSLRKRGRAMNLADALGFAAVAVTLIAVPGPDWAYILAAGARDRVVWPAVAGLMLGYSLITVVIAVGLGPITTKLPLLLIALTFAGAGYLAHLGVRTLRSTATIARAGGPGAAGPHHTRLHRPWRRRQRAQSQRCPAVPVDPSPVRPCLGTVAAAGSARGARHGVRPHLRRLLRRSRVLCPPCPRIPAGPRPPHLPDRGFGDDPPRSRTDCGTGPRDRTRVTPTHPPSSAVTFRRAFQWTLGGRPGRRCGG